MNEKTCKIKETNKFTDTTCSNLTEDNHKDCFGCIVWNRYVKLERDEKLVKIFKLLNLYWINILFLDRDYCYIQSKQEYIKQFLDFAQNLDSSMELFTLNKKEIIIKFKMVFENWKIEFLVK